MQICKDLDGLKDTTQVLLINLMTERPYSGALARLHLEALQYIKKLSGCTRTDFTELPRQSVRRDCVD